MKNLFKALADFQQECPIIHKGTKGYGYSYASLAEILEVINPIMNRHNLGFTQLAQGNSIKTIVFHHCGESIESVLDIPSSKPLKGMNEYQSLGSAITYIRRYALSSALGIVTDVDNDASGNKAGNDNAPEPDEKEWFNPLDRQGQVTEQGNNWLKVVKAKGLDQAIQIAKNNYKVSKASIQWMQNQ